MIELPQVTLVCLTGVNYKTVEHQRALEYSQRGIKFGAVKFIQLPKIKDINSWNEAVIYDLPKFIDTDFCLFIHDDGYVINPELWNEKWLQYDFIGAPWPLPRDNYSYRDETGQLQRVGNSVSLRSKRLMDLIATRPWAWYYGNCNEDGFITCHNRKWLERQGCKFAPLEIAVHFSKEHEIPENKDLRTFMFHSL